MPEEHKTHYRKLCPTRFLGAHDMDGKDFTLTIKSVHAEELIDVEKTKKEHKEVTTTKSVIEFEKAKKPWVAVLTNMQAIAKIHGDYVEDWIGKQITLYPTKVRAFGEMKDCVRVRGAAGSTSINKGL